MNESDATQKQLSEDIRELSQILRSVLEAVHRLSNILVRNIQ